MWGFKVNNIGLDVETTWKSKITSYFLIIIENIRIIANVRLHYVHEKRQ